MHADSKTALGVHGLGLVTLDVAFDDDGIPMVTNVKRVIRLDMNMMIRASLMRLIMMMMKTITAITRRRKPMTIMMRMKMMTNLMMKSIMAI
jgi:hypothetical protein